jgi:hypothetical protein
MNPEETWISVKTLAEIKNVTARAVRLSIPKCNYVFREVSSSGLFFTGWFCPLGGFSFSLYLGITTPLSLEKGLWNGFSFMGVF